MNRPRVCLVLDNPLRDLDGLALIAWHLVREGVEVFLVPMHLQGFEIPALKPDLVLANYLRRNNRDLLKMYKKMGSRIAILDTEGAGGNWWGDYARLVSSTHSDRYIDQYFCWGHDQRDHLLSAKALPDEKIHVAGCPRYDFIADPWRSTLNADDIAPGYILINTNFPIVNPRFAKGTKAELKTWSYVGWGADRAEKLASAATRVHGAVKSSVRELAQAFPDQQFVLRPHPFERVESYSDLLDLPNIAIRQEGTSVQWINHAKALLHLNCFTAIEAGLMGIEAIAFEWLNEPALSDFSSEPRRVSRNAANNREVMQWLKALIKGEHLPAIEERTRTLDQLTHHYYHAMDGRSSCRVANLLLQLLGTAQADKTFDFKSIGYRQRTVSAFRKLLGYRIAYGLRSLSLGKDIQGQRDDKIPSVNTVTTLLDRISNVAGRNHVVEVRYADRTDYSVPRMGSSKSIRLG